jgi:hypothetical protein
LNDTIIYPCDHETCHTRFVCLNANEEWNQRKLSLTHQKTPK